ncbi:hypothetical protein [Actinokineospora bangkokensis]|uniref:Uncharacterized protein n=1 Tax=Actinokineospora bangkokensis TaxID=1193682 RepID=A0A1Q9LFB2_9PSEU|nr:hypothetical protein [Actinokineospora bangkokensis]OLR90713.1 hypothetical protein BJP25_29400 [Actinokineospora bangkokensis]
MRTRARSTRDTVAGVLVLVALVALPLLSVRLIGVIHAQAAPAVAVPTTTPAPTTPAEVPIAWTAEQARRALAAGSVARLPGAPAVVDEAALRPVLARTGWRVLLLPFTGSDGRERHRGELDRLRAALGGDDRLVVVSGLRVEAGRSHQLIGPRDMAEVAAVLGTADVTEPVLSAVLDGHVRATPDPVPAGGVDEVAAALASTGRYTAPGLAPVGPAPDALVAVLPAGQPTDLTARLGERFPGERVVVVRGRWVEVAGPDPDLVRTAVTAYYGRSYFRLAEWGPDPLALGSLVLAEVDQALAARAAAATAPAVDDQPPAWRSAALPWALACAAVLLVGVPAALRLRPARRRLARAEADLLLRDHLAAEVAALAADLATVRAHSRPHAELPTSAATQRATAPAPGLADLRTDTTQHAEHHGGTAAATRTHGHGTDPLTSVTDQQVEAHGLRLDHADPAADPPRARTRSHDPADLLADAAVEHARARDLLLDGADPAAVQAAVAAARAALDEVRFGVSV